MLFIVAYLVGCFFIGLGLTARRPRYTVWLVVTGSALVCALYLLTDPSFLSGFSFASLATGATHDTDREATRAADSPQSPAPVVSWETRLAHSSLADAFTRIEQPPESVMVTRLGFVLFLLGAATIVLRPLYGLYLILFFSLVGDAVLLPWYPFVKGFSSRESLFFIHDAFIVSPLEIYIALTVISWFVRQIVQGHTRTRTGSLFRPTLLFTVFVAIGFAYGVATGGDLRIALWEARPVCYLIALLFMTSNLVDTPAQASNLLWIALLAIFLKGVNGSLHYLLVLKTDLRGIESITEHAAAIHLNVLFVSALAVWMYRTSRLTRTLLPLAIPFVLLGYIATQRRAAFVTLAVACLLTVVLLFKENRRLFWIGAPALALLGTVYVGMYWNSRSTIAVPAQAIKSVIAAQLASPRDQSSNNYRVLENLNISFTIRQHPIAGIGFGQKFSIVAPMPDISELFEWWEYIPHNSMMWIWMKAGIGGFLSMLCLIGLAVAGGVRTLGQLRSPTARAVVMTAILYFVMHFIYACVDMSWDAKSTVMVGTLMGIVNCAEWLESSPGEARWSRRRASLPRSEPAAILD